MRILVLSNHIASAFLLLGKTLTFATSPVDLVVFAQIHSADLVPLHINTMNRQETHCAATPLPLSDQPSLIELKLRAMKRFKVNASVPPQTPIGKTPGHFPKCTTQADLKSVLDSALLLCDETSDLDL